MQLFLKFDFVYRIFFKRLFDLLVSLFTIVFSLPFLILIIAFLIFINHVSPFYLQQRTGKGGKSFVVIKFKTMEDKRDSSGRLLPDSKRLTKIGKLLRAFSLDELPQLFNVLKGDMSLVGPRPLLPEYLPLYNERQARRHEVRPGITGWAQINGRNNLSWEEKFEMDVWYVDNISFKLDMKILFLTIVKVLKREGINAGENITMEKFKGSTV
ncbi:MAG TPA: sugar transferase [Bacteroidales bacterium]|nr:sugar transferase [Bacteroidales bacterium]